MEIGLIQGTLFSKNLVLVTKPELFRELYSNPGIVIHVYIYVTYSIDVFIKNETNKAFKYIFGDGILTKNGDAWTRHKRVFNKAFIQSKYGDIVESTFKELSDQLTSMAQSNYVAPIHELVNRAVFQTMGLFAYNENYQTIKGDLKYYDLYHRIMASRRNLPKIIQFLNLDPKGPFGALIPELKKDRQELYAHFDDIIKTDRQARLDDPERFKKRTDFLASLLESQGKLPEGYTDEEIAVDLLTLFMAGHDTTAGSISYTLYNLARHPEYQEHVQGAIKAFNVIPSVLHKLSLKELRTAFPLLHSVILESWRLYPPAIGGFLRVARCNTCLGGYKIPKGTYCIPSIISIHRSKAIWGEDVMEFRPERFDEDPSLVNNLVQFGEGRHKCHGLLFAEIQIFQGLITLLEKFTFSIPDDSPHKDRVQVKPFSGIMSPDDLKLTISINNM